MEAQIDTILSIYMLLMIEIIGEDQLSSEVIKLVILMREYFNITGWDYRKHLEGFGLLETVEGEELMDYTQMNTPEEIPELINDFIESFLGLDEKMFGTEITTMSDLITNFCNWLYTFRLTNFKVTPSLIN